MVAGVIAVDNSKSQKQRNPGFKFGRGSVI